MNIGGIWQSLALGRTLSCIVVFTTLFLAVALGYAVSNRDASIQLIIEVGGWNSDGRYNTVVTSDALATRMREVLIPIVADKSKFGSSIKIYRVYPAVGTNDVVARLGCDRANMDRCQRFVEDLYARVQAEHSEKLERLREYLNLQIASWKKISQIRREAIATSKSWVGPVQSAVTKPPAVENEAENPWRDLKGLAFLTDAVQKFPELLVESETKIEALQLQLKSVQPTQKSLVVSEEPKYSTIAIAGAVLLGVVCGLFFSFAIGSAARGRSPPNLA
jgi:hypothetical protein